jgi:D-amino-acid dehydrogenase
MSGSLLNIIYDFVKIKPCKGENYARRCHQKKKNHVNTLNEKLDRIFRSDIKGNINVKNFVEQNINLNNKTVVVIGSGIVGLVNAFVLCIAGAKVIVVEKGSDVCLSSSFQNGGQLSFGHVDSIASMQNFLSIFTFKNPIKVSIFSLFDINFLKFAYAFICNINNKKRRLNLEVLKKLSDLSKKTFFEFFLPFFNNDELQEMRYNSRGTIHYFYDKRYFVSKIRHYESLGIDFSILSAKDSIELDPSLINVENLCGGLYFKNDHSLSCIDMGRVLKSFLIKSGVDFKFDTNFNNYTIKDNQLIDSIKADYYIFASGVASSDILNKVCKNYNLDVSIYPMTGYSFNIDTEYSNFAPQYALTDSKTRIVYSVQDRIVDKNSESISRSQNLRVAGFADFFAKNTIKKMSNLNDCSDAKKNTKTRAFLLYKFFIKNFRVLKNSTLSASWTGFRASTPNSVPILIGGYRDIGIKNVFINTGHTNLGLTMSFASAIVTASQISLESAVRVDV